MLLKRAQNKLYIYINKLWRGNICFVSYVILLMILRFVKGKGLANYAYKRELLYFTFCYVKLLQSFSSFFARAFFELFIIFF